MTHSTSTTWTKGMSFEATIDNHKIVLDAMPDHGGEDKGASPKKLLLAGLSGCSGMDVVSILAKMKSSPKHFKINIDAELSEENPKYYKDIHIVYEFDKNVPEDKAKKAIDLSLDKYCGVNQMLKQLAKITYEIQFI